MSKELQYADETLDKVHLVRGGHEYFKLLLGLIKGATKNIHLQTYIFADDETGELVASALCEAARRGVAVYLLVDGYASQRLSKNFISALRFAGIRLHFFEPLLNSSGFYFGRRLHHKLFVADATHALVAGINVANRYNDLNGSTAWLDFAVYARGPVAQELADLCISLWPASAGFPKARRNETYLSLKHLEHGHVAIKRNDWVNHKNEISASYISMFKHAKQQITIMCSYFLPGKIIRRSLRNAAKRGVRIRVIIAGPSDVWLAKQAERWLYDWLLRNNIELYEYQPSVLHAKIAVADDEWMTIGSYNLNDISTYASVELNLSITDPAFTKNVRNELDAIIKKSCIRIARGRSRYSKNIFIQFIRWNCYQMVRVLFQMFTFYYKQKRN